jgi:hypothetical protein
VRRILTSRDQDLTITHNLPHELSPITPPPRYRSDIPAQVALAFILDVEREDVLRQIFPLWRTINQLIRVFQDMSNAVVEVSNAVRVGVPGRHIVVAGFPDGAVEGGERVFADVGVVAPAAELVAVVEGDCEFDIWKRPDVSDANVEFPGWVTLPRSWASTIN